jgi:hypothetical protein
MILSALLVALLSAGEATQQQPRLTAQDLEPIARVGIQRVLSRVLDVPVTVASVKLLPDEQRMVLNDVKIANPQGFEAPNAITADAVEIAADVQSLFSPSPEIKLVQVSGAKVNAETKLPQGSNITKLLNNAKAARQGPLAGRAPKQWRIEKGVLKGAEVNVGTQLLASQNMQRKIGNIEMDFMGENGRGMPAQEAMARFLARLVDELNILPGQTGGAGVLEKVLPELAAPAAKETEPNRPGQRLRETIKNLRK